MASAVALPETAISFEVPDALYRGRKLRVKAPGQDRLVNWFIVAFTLLSLGLLFSLNVNWLQLFSRLPNLGDTFWRLGHLTFDRFDLTVVALLESISIAVISTVYSALVGLLVAAFAARNLVRNRVTPFLITSFATFIRAVPTPVVVLMAMASFGLGPVPGVVGMTLSSTAFFVRAFAQGFEDVPAGTIEALQAAGANRVQIFVKAVIPSSLSNLVAWTGLRFEMNFTGSAILGMVGAGGIGSIITRSVQGHDFGVAGVAILLVFAFAYSIEMLFTHVKRSYLQ